MDWRQPDSTAISIIVQQLLYRLNPGLVLIADCADNIIVVCESVAGSASPVDVRPVSCGVPTVECAHVWLCVLVASWLLLQW